ncbi:MAG: DUF2459 domain-containing protein [Pseudomonadota bacterium]
MIRRLIGACGALIAAYLIAGTLGGMIKVGSPPPPDAERRIGLLPGPIHTDILLPTTPEVREQFGFLAADGLFIDAPEVAWLVTGWGARDFYTTTGGYTDLRPGPVFRAVTGDSAVMRVFLGGTITDDTGITWITLSDAQFAAVVEQVRTSFDGDLPTPLEHPGLNGRDLFYPAQGRFHLFRTCNVWVGNVLRKAGVEVGVWTPFTWSLP